MLLTASAAGQAPALATTGNPIFNRTWTLLRLPALTLPVGSGADGLPLGVQLVSAVPEEHNFFAVARWMVEELALTNR